MKNHRAWIQTGLLGLLLSSLVFTPSASAASGKIMVVDYYATWCGPCRAMAPALEAMARSDPSIRLRRVNIVSFNSPIARRLHIGSIPYVVVHDRHGRLVGTVTGAFPNLVMHYVAIAKQRG